MIIFNFHTWKLVVLIEYYYAISDHYSVLADHEPLYQFYASAVARAAFESDSEGYEEVKYPFKYNLFIKTRCNFEKF